MTLRFLKNAYRLTGLRHALRIRPSDGLHRWLLAPPSLRNCKVCLFATYSGGEPLSKHTRHLAKCWSERGYRVILIVATDRFRDQSWNETITTFPFVAGILLRSNAGYDFGSWSTLLRLRRDIRFARLLALANDSVFGPLEGFDAMLQLVEKSEGDVIAMTDSHEHTHHMQSYLVFYKPSVLKRRAFKVFWSQIGDSGREETIQNAELPQLAWFRRFGFEVVVLFPSLPGSTDNPTLTGWRTLIEAGFPFVKVQLLRENPWHADLANWEVSLRQHGYDTTLVADHLGAAYPDSAAARAAVRQVANPEVVPH